MKPEIVYNPALVTEKSHRRTKKTGRETPGGESGCDEKVREIVAWFMPELINMDLRFLRWEGLNC